MDSVQDTQLVLSGFPHSEISGSKSVCRLPEAYRRLPRLSSPLTAKASTVCAYSLDHITPSNLGITVVKTTFAENSHSLFRATHKFYLSLILPAVKLVDQSIFLSHTQIFKERFWKRPEINIPLQCEGMLISKLSYRGWWWSQAGSNR